MTVRVRLDIGGIVQGVGFRPFVYRLAREHGLSGWVFNHAAGVTVEAEGEREDVDALITALREDPPYLAAIDRLDVSFIPPCGEILRFIERLRLHNGSFPQIDDRVLGVELVSAVKSRTYRTFVHLCRAVIVRHLQRTGRIIQLFRAVAGHKAGRSHVRVVESLRRIGRNDIPRRIREHPLQRIRGRLL